MLHVQLKQRRNVASAFNLTERAVRARFIEPMLADRNFDYADKEWDPRTAKLKVLEGRELRPDELMFGRGWSNAERNGTDVTEQMLSGTRPAAAAPPALEALTRLKDRIIGRISAGPLPLTELVPMTGDLLPGQLVSERLALSERAAWELLHHGGASLWRAGQAIDNEQWQATLLSPDSWTGTANPVELAAAQE